jgi:probable HAF family extracellular repeat protein
MDDPLASQVPAGIIGTQPDGINNLGEIVGTYFDAQGLAHAFLDNGGILTTIDDGGAPTHLTGINDAGQIVGYTSSGAFLYSGGEFSSLGGYYPYDINDEGQIVGAYGSGITQGFLLSSGGFTTITPL